MNKQFLTFLGIGITAAVVIIGAMLFVNRGSQIRLDGQILKVRTLAADERSAIAVIDFRFVNPADYAFVVSKVTVTLEDKDGKQHEGKVVSELDAKRMFEYHPVLGQKFNETLLMRDKLAPRQSLDKMVAARFEIPEAEIESRKKLSVLVHDVDGPVSVIQ